MIYDCTFIFNELDTLEIRLNTLKDVIDRVVLVEASWTHTGKPKEFIFEKNRERFRPFLDRIIHIKLTEADLPPLPTDGAEINRSWIRENTQRNGIAKGLADAKQDDLIIISDLDEIPSPDSVRTAAKNPQGITNVAIRNYSFWLNNANVSAPWHYLGPKILTVATFRDPATYATATYPSCAPRAANPIPSATLIRFSPQAHTIYGGWHFSSQGGLARIREKINNVAEATLVNGRFQDIEEISRQLQRGGSLTPGVTDVLIPEPLTHDFPPFIVENLTRFAAQLLPATDEQWQKSKWKRHHARLMRVVHDRFIGFLINAVPRGLHPFCRKVRKIIGI